MRLFMAELKYFKITGSRYNPVKCRTLTNERGRECEDLPSESCCSAWDPRFPMLEVCWMQNCECTGKKERGFLFKPPLWLLPALSTGALSEWLLLMLSPPSSSVSPFCSSLWPSWFLPAFHFFFTFLLSLPLSFSLQRTGRQAKLFSSHSERLGFAFKAPCSLCSLVSHADRGVRN